MIFTGGKVIPSILKCCGSGLRRTCCARNRVLEKINGSGPRTVPLGHAARGRRQTCQSQTLVLNTGCFFVLRQICEHRRGEAKPQIICDWRDRNVSTLQCKDGLRSIDLKLLFIPAGPINLITHQDQSKCLVKAQVNINQVEK